jgi:5-methylcytosine-specific restriction endonuclease McrA
LLSDLPYLDKHQFVDKLVERHLLDAAPPSSSSSSPGPAPPLSLTAQSSTSFMPALVLNADYQPLSFTPLSLWSWQEAVKAVFRGKVTVVDVYENVVVRGVSLEIPLPSVIALNEYVSNHKSIPAFTKRNVYLRDEYKCCYCNDQFFSQSDLSIDHVHPRCRGGRLDWENAVVRTGTSSAVSKSARMAGNVPSSGCLVEEFECGFVERLTRAALSLDLLSNMQRTQGEPRRGGAGIGGDEVAAPSQGALAVRAVADRVPAVAAASEGPPDVEAVPGPVCRAMKDCWRFRGPCELPLEVVQRSFL